jgi:hypothetical protein
MMINVKKMKKILYLILIFSMTGLYSCYKMDSVYEEFIVPDGIVYPQKVDSLKAYSGQNRIQLEWLKPIDPKVVRARIYWNNYTDSLEIAIPSNQNKISQIIENLNETTYTFYVKTYDAEGHVSIPVEVSGKAYGTIYQASLISRPLLGIAFFPDRAELSWGPADEAAIKLVLKYRNASGELIEQIVPVNESVTTLTDYQLGSTFTTETYFRPTPTAIDEFAATDEQKFPEMVKLAKNSWTNAQLPTDSWYPADGNYNMWGLENLWRGPEAPSNNANGMCFASHGPVSPLPQHFTIDLGYKASLSRMRIWPLLLGTSEVYGDLSPRTFELWGTDNPPVDGSFDNWSLLGTWEVYKPSGYEAGGAVGVITAEDTQYFNYEQEYVIGVSAATPDANRAIRYIRFKTLNTFSTYNTGASTAFVAFAEMALWGTYVNE